MNAVEIEEAVSALVEQPFDPAEFPYAFLAAFGNKDATLRRLRTGDTNKSDLGGVLQRNNIHLATAPAGEVATTLAALRESPATAKHKAKFILATDGDQVEAEQVDGAESLACAWAELPDHFGFFLPLAGITTVRQIRENAFDIRATSKLNKLYVELLKVNPAWGTDARRPDMNHFMARLIFSFFAEDTGIMPDRGLFSATVSQMSAADSSNTHEVIGALFRAMNTPLADRAAAALPRWAAQMPYVNGGLFAGSMDVPRFSRTARAYLLQVGQLDWTQVNPDIFGSMIQAVADDEERGALGMHYTSVPNILKVLNPLFLDELREKLAAAGDNPRTLLNLRKRLARIRVFDPACGSGNFLVIAYKELRAIEHEINVRRGEAGRRSEIPLTNFRGIELRDFAAEIARLALIIAEFQCDELYRGQKEAIRDFLPLSAENWIVCGNSLRLDWLAVCPPAGTGVKVVGDDLFGTPVEQAEIDFENAGGETYACGNPPYLGGKKLNAEQKDDMARIFGRTQHKNLDYVCAFFHRAAVTLTSLKRVALVTTDSISQGTHVPVLWPILWRLGARIDFAYETFKWSNSAQRNAGVSCTIVGLSRTQAATRWIYGRDSRREAKNINAYLIDGPDLIVEPRSTPLGALSRMITGNAAYDGGHLFMSAREARAMKVDYPEAQPLLREVMGTSEFMEGAPRFCLWIDDDELPTARQLASISQRIDAVLKYRQTGGEVARTLMHRPHQFRYRHTARSTQILVPQVSSASREYLPIGFLDARAVITHLAHAIYEPSLLDFSILASRLHLTWIRSICGKLGTAIRYSSNLGWNTFPLPSLTEQNKSDLTRCAEDILLAREAHYPATIADLYDPETMPADLRAAHERNDEVLERIYIGRRFRNDTERLEKLFAMYTQLTARERPTAPARRRRA